ncbi:hypothetical protein K491DRAFT_217070 [Lophiostoma macrostomum CBS 122681]|uniref:Uncharacterized protein n=1 Tax=Lophiostoma macrostomum CBS 122681 TaxID=1314788 RepID=A0A6A6TIL4_9PLEO|nr:hypothetical protein K491DRAFT_217070 [Lophiostoma macrostomum CBS 122681]
MRPLLERKIPTKTWDMIMGSVQSLPVAAGFTLPDSQLADAARCEISAAQPASLQKETLAAVKAALLGFVRTTVLCMAPSLDHAIAARMRFARGFGSPGRLSARKPRRPEEQPPRPLLPATCTLSRLSSLLSQPAIHMTAHFMRQSGYHTGPWRAPLVAFHRRGAAGACVCKPPFRCTTRCDWMSCENDTRSHALIKSITCIITLSSPPSQALSSPDIGSARLT